MPVAAPAARWPSWGRSRSRLAVLSVPQSASSCLENASSSHDLLALKKYFRLNYTNVSALGSPGPGSRQSRAAVPAGLGLCRCWSSAGGDAEPGGARPPPPSPQSGLPGAGASSLGSCLLPELCPALPVPCLPSLPALLAPQASRCCRGSQLLTAPTHPQLWDLLWGGGVPFFLQLCFGGRMALLAGGDVSQPGG